MRGLRDDWKVGVVMFGSVPKCGQDGCTGHLGKFDSCQTEALWQMSLDGGDETTGESDFEGHLTLVLVDEPYDERLDVDEVVIVTIPAGAYLVESLSSGAVYSMRYDTEAGARIVFEEADARYSAWLDADDESS